MILEGWELVFAIAAVFVSAVVAGTVGFGMGMVLSPFMLLVVEPQTLVLAVNTLSCVGLGIVGVRGRREVARESIRPLVVAGLVGIPVGLLALQGIPATPLKIAIAVVIVLLAIISISRRRVPIPESRLVDAGFGFGGLALVTALGVGPPIVAWHLFNKGLGARSIRVTIAIYYSSTALVAIILYTALGLFTVERWLLTLALLPPTLVGFGVGSLLMGRVNEVKLRFAVLAVIMISGLTLLAREIYGILG